MINNNLINILDLIESNINRDYSRYKIKYIPEAKNIEIYFYNDLNKLNKDFIQVDDDYIYLWSNFKREYIMMSLEDIKFIIMTYFI